MCVLTFPSIMGKIADNSLKDDVSSASNGWQEVTRRSLEAGRMLAFLFRSVWPIFAWVLISEAEDRN